MSDQQLAHDDAWVVLITKCGHLSKIGVDDLNIVLPWQIGGALARGYGDSGDETIALRGCPS